MATFQNKSGIQEIYSNYNPAFNNIYTVTIMDSGTNGIASAEDINYFLQFQAPGVSFNGESLNLERNWATKKFQVSSSPYTWSDTLTIKWRESDDWRVKKFHENWISLFYDRSDDSFISYESKNAITEAGLYKDFKILLPTSKSKNAPTAIIFKNVLPSRVGDFNFAWTSSPSVISHSMTYYVEDWYWEESSDGEA